MGYHALLHVSATMLEKRIRVSRAQVCSHLSLSQAHKNTLKVKTISSISICCFSNITITSLSAAAATPDRKDPQQGVEKALAAFKTFVVAKKKIIIPNFRFSYPKV